MSTKAKLYAANKLLYSADIQPYSNQCWHYHPTYTIKVVNPHWEKILVCGKCYAKYEKDVAAYSEIEEIQEAMFEPLLKEMSKMNDNFASMSKSIAQINLDIKHLMALQNKQELSEVVIPRESKST